MPDLYVRNEAGDMSSFLQILIQNSSSLSAATTGSETAAGDLLGGPGAPAESSTSFRLSGPNCLIAGESNGMNTFNRVNNRERPESCEVPFDLAPPRSSKRNRDAEVHNFSEKKRRSRINEKIKALQTLIPNSNKTDKASMLDEAIEYLKQLQLQVQMLTMRNRLSLLPGYSVGSLQSTLTPSAEADLDDGNAPLNVNRGTNTLCQDPNVSMKSFLPMLVPPTRNTDSNSGALPSFVPSMEIRCASKDICRDATLSRTQMDISRTGNTSSPGISS